MMVLAQSVYALMFSYIFNGYIIFLIYDLKYKTIFDANNTRSTDSTRFAFNNIVIEAFEKNLNNMNDMINIWNNVTCNI